MLPRKATSKSSYSAPSNSESASDFTITKPFDCPNLFYFNWAQLGSFVAPLFHHIESIIGGCSKEHMRRVAACSVITSVEHAQHPWIFPVSQFEDYAGGLHWSPEMNGWVAASVQIAKPRPTFSLSARLYFLVKIKLLTCRQNRNWNMIGGSHMASSVGDAVRAARRATTAAARLILNHGDSGWCAYYPPEAVT